MCISFNIPLELIENIFDFWLYTYKDKEAREICLGLLKMRKRISLTNLIKSGSIKGNSKNWAMKVETLHCYKPNSLKSNQSNDTGMIHKHSPDGKSMIIEHHTCTEFSA